MMLPHLAIVSFYFFDLPSPVHATLAITLRNGQPLLCRPIKVKRPVPKPGATHGPSDYGKRFTGRPHKAYDSPKRATPTFDWWACESAAAPWAKTRGRGGGCGLVGCPGWRIRRWWMRRQGACLGGTGCGFLVWVPVMLGYCRCEMRRLTEGLLIAKRLVEIVSLPESKHELPGNHCCLFVDFPDEREVEAAYKAVSGMQRK